MDYVLFGMGYGATLMLIGWALRTFGPERKYNNIDPEDVDLTILQRRWVRFIQGLGGVIAIAGTAMVLFTFVVMLVNPDDETGGFTALVIWGFLLISILVWCWFYVSRYGVTGIWSRDGGYGIRGGGQPRLSQASSADRSSSRVVPKPHVSEPEALESADEPPASQPIASAEENNTEAVSSEPIEPTVNGNDVAPDAPVVDESESTSDPEYDFGDSSDTTVPSDIGGRAEAIRRLRERQSRTGPSTD